MPEVTADRTGYVCVQDRTVYREYFGRGDREAICLLNDVVMSTRSWSSSSPNYSRNTI